MLTPDMHLQGSLANCLGFGEGALPAAFQSEILREVLRQNAAQDDMLWEGKTWLQEGVKKLTSVWAPNRETTFAFSNPSETIDRIPAGFLLHVAKFKTQFLHSFQARRFQRKLSHSGSQDVL